MAHNKNLEAVGGFQQKVYFDTLPVHTRILLTTHNSVYRLTIIDDDSKTDTLSPRERTMVQVERQSRMPVWGDTAAWQKVQDANLILVGNSPQMLRLPNADSQHEELERGALATESRAIFFAEDSPERKGGTLSTSRVYEISVEYTTPE